MVVQRASYTGVLLALLWAMTGCSSMSVKYDFDNEANFESFQTYNWISTQRAVDPHQFGGNPLNYKRAVQAIERELEAKGIPKDDNNPDFLVAIHGGSQDKVQVSTYGYSYGYWGGYMGYPYANVYTYQEGTLIIDFIDAEDHELFWRGWATAVIDRAEDPARKITEAVGKILAYYPPK